MRFSRTELTSAEIEHGGVLHCPCHGLVVTEYKYRALAVLEDEFHRYACKKYPPEYNCLWEIEEFKPMFNEIHRAVIYYVNECKLSVHEALLEFITPSKGRKVVDLDGHDAC